MSFFAAKKIKFI